MNKMILVVAAAFVVVFFMMKGKPDMQCSESQRLATVCTQELNYVCGSDGMTYTSPCEACKGKDLTFKYAFNACPAILNNND